jgi:aminoglycoside 2''-phosphotransferase
MEQLPAAIQAAIPGLTVVTVEPAGEGDYCSAYAFDDTWIVLVARHEEASRCLERVAALLPRLAPELPLPIPNVTASGQLASGDQTFVIYPRIHGGELTGTHFHTLPATTREDVTAELASFLRTLHSFPVGEAQAAGVAVCEYPFSARDDGLLQVSAAEQYMRDLDQLLAWDTLDHDLRDYCRRIIDQHLDDMRRSPSALVLLHGELSQDHVLFDTAAGKITGIIDFNGMIIGDPVRDLLYLYEDYGLEFIDVLLRYYPVEDRATVLARLHFLHEWHTVLRLLWALDHQYAAGIERRLQELRVLHSLKRTPPWRAII